MKRHQVLLENKMTSVDRIQWSDAVHTVNKIITKPINITSIRLKYTFYILTWQDFMYKVLITIARKCNNKELL